MKKLSRKLNLNRETIIPLTPDILDGINGGVTPAITTLTQTSTVPSVQRRTFPMVHCQVADPWASIACCTNVEGPTGFKRKISISAPVGFLNFSRAGMTLVLFITSKLLIRRKSAICENCLCVIAPPS